MKSHEVFQRMPDDLAGEILSYFQENRKPVYRAALAVLAGQRKLRPQFVERKPRAERHAWMKAQLSRKTAQDAAQELLQTWLLEEHAPVVTDFLAELEIAHDGSGIVETLPEEPPAGRLEAAVRTLLQKHRPEVVAVYLHLFQDIDEAHWPTLQAILDRTPGLALGGAPAEGQPVAVAS